MQVTLAGTLLRIQWKPLPPDIEAEVVQRLESIYSAIKGNMPRTWYVHLDRLNEVMEQFPGAQYAPEVIAAYPVRKPLVQGELLKAGDQVFAWQRKGKRQKTSNRKGTQHG